MKIFGREINRIYARWIILHVFIVIDIILITIAMFFTLPENIASAIQNFDLCVCIVLLAEWIYTFHISKPKRIFLKQKSNWIDLIASIPFDVIFQTLIPYVNLLRYLRLLKLLRVMALFSRFFNGVERFFKKTNLDKIIGGIVFTVIIFTLLMQMYKLRPGLLDNLYFVVVTLTTVGYGDIEPVTSTQKIITIALIVIGIFVFSTVTAAISSYFTDRLLKEDEKMEDDFTELDEKVSGLTQDIELLVKQNQDLKQEIGELKEMVKKLE